MGTIAINLDIHEEITVNFESQKISIIRDTNISEAIFWLKISSLSFAELGHIIVEVEINVFDGTPNMKLYYHNSELKTAETDSAIKDYIFRLFEYMKTAEYLRILQHQRKHELSLKQDAYQAAEQILKSRKQELDRAESALAEANAKLKMVEDEQPLIHPSNYEPYSTVTPHDTAVSLTYVKLDDMFEVVVFYGDSSEQTVYKGRVFRQAAREAQRWANLKNCSWSDEPARYWMQKAGMSTEAIHDRIFE